MTKQVQAVDLFCGAGGTSSGILKACERLSQRPIHLTAVNHWQTAINTHSLNHPHVRHICEPVENLHPLDLVKSGHLDLLAASCECRFHSNARGGGPCNEQSRAQPWQLVRWATDVNVANILMENVREFRNWGPLHPRTKRPIKSRKGEFFRAFLNALGNLGYQVEWKIQCAADFGDPTSRERLMLMARRGLDLIWPEASHGQAWKAARECIDWSIQGKDIFGKSGKPRHCANTMERIKAGLIKFGGENAQPFLVMLNGTTDAHLSSCAKSLNEPMPTATCSNRAMLVEPFVMHLTHQGAHGSRCHSVDKPMPTITGAHRGELALIEPFIVQTDHTGGNGAYVRDIDRPIPTIVTKQNLLLVEPFILKYYRTGICKPVSEPFDTITTKPRFMLVQCERGQYGIGLRTRMIQPSEMQLAHSFPATYQFTGNKEEQTKQIGNSVPVELAAAHAKVLIE